MKAKPPRDGPHKLRPDVAETAYRVMLEATGQAPKTQPGQGEKNPEAVDRGRQGGKARADILTPAELVAIAKKGAATRWDEQKKKPPKARRGRSR